MFGSRSGKVRLCSAAARGRDAPPLHSSVAQTGGMLGHACGGWGLITPLILVVVIIDDIIVGNLIDRLRRRDFLGAAHYLRDIAQQLWAVWLVLGSAALAGAIAVWTIARTPD